MSYFWINDRVHNVGDVIPPGNWGGLVKSIPNHRWLHMEQQFETIRLKINPRLPSRLECVFVCEDLEIIKLLQLKRPNDLIYEVELLDKSQPTYKADMALVHPELEQYNAQVGNPTKYWSNNHGEEIKWPEILTLSPLKILKQF